MDSRDNQNKRQEHNTSQDNEHWEVYGQPAGPSEIAARVQSLKSSVLTAAAKRDRLPRTLFWSLFRAEIDVIKKRKDKRRILQSIT